MHQNDCRKTNHTQCAPSEVMQILSFELTNFESFAQPLVFRWIPQISHRFKSLLFPGNSTSIKCFTFKGFWNQFMKSSFLWVWKWSSICVKLLLPTDGFIRVALLNHHRTLLAFLLILLENMELRKLNVLARILSYEVIELQPSDCCDP